MARQAPFGETVAQVRAKELADALKAHAEQRRLALTLAADYSKIARSRFHALRLFWISVKSLTGFRSKRERYAIWSPDLAMPPSALSGATRALPQSSMQAAPAPAIAIPDAERRLFAAWTARVAARENAAEPLVSIVIPVYNKLDVTLRCLQSIADTWFDTIPVQVIVVDDGSRDRTGEALSKLPGLDYVRNGSNQGFVGACNRGAAIAGGKYICFLNNDTEVREAWLDHLVNLIESDPRVGAVGSKLIYPDGTLQEAGGIIWRDASGWNYGRGGDPADSRFNYVRDVDYCSGAALLVRTDLFRSLGGFAREYAPAYYEDADLCFAIRNAGYRVVYQPKSEVIHHEGVTSGTDIASGVKRHQELNRPKFQKKWAGVLERHLEGGAVNVAAGARRHRAGSTVLIVDSYVPMHDKDAGSARLKRIIHMLRSSGYHVVFLPDNYAALQPYTSELQAWGVEVLHHTEKGISMQHALNEVLPILDYAWICRPQLFEKYAKSIRRNRATSILYDTIDLHFVRGRREAALSGSSDESWKGMERLEMQCAAEADATIVVTQPECNLLLERGVHNVHIVPTLHDMEVDRPRSFTETADILFIGGYNHTPNVDAAKWLCREIMPIVWKAAPDARVHLLGSNPGEDVLALANDRIAVPGYIPDVTEYFLKSRVFVAPLRFGAGIKGKIGQALSFALPCVITDIAAEGFGLENERDCLIANDADAFAAAVLRFLTDEKLWERISSSSRRALAPFGTRAVKPRLVSMLKQLKKANVTEPASERHRPHV